MSAKREVKARITEFLVNPAKYFFIKDLATTRHSFIGGYITGIIPKMKVQYVQANRLLAFA